MNTLSLKIVNEYLEIPKHIVGTTTIDLPCLGHKKEYAVQAIGKNIRFRMIIRRGNRRLSLTIHKMTRDNVGMFRLDINGSEHILDNGKKSRNHIHYYTEEYGLRKAKELPREFNNTLSDHVAIVGKALDYLNIKAVTIQNELL